MPQLLAKIISSESHLLYFARVLDATECAAPPLPSHITFGRFVEIAAHPEASLVPGDPVQSGIEPVKDERVIGLVVNTRLLNPEGPHHGPRLSVPHSHNAIFAPDHMNEVGILVAILLVGQLSASSIEQGVPPTVLPVGSEVFLASQETLQRFHHDQQRRFQLRYFPLLGEAGRAMGPALLKQIAAQLAPICDDKARRILQILQKNMAWEASASPMQRT